MSTAIEVGKKLVQLCNQGKNLDAIQTLYSPGIVSIEARENPAFPARVEGVAGVKEKNQWWYKNHEVHKAEAIGPFPHGDRFIVHFKYDVTAKVGPMAGKRMNIEEAALYTVKGGKIAQEEFFYHMG